MNGKPAAAQPAEGDGLATVNAIDKAAPGEGSLSDCRAGGWLLCGVAFALRQGPAEGPREQVSWLFVLDFGQTPHLCVPCPLLPPVAPCCPTNPLQEASLASPH